MIADSQGKRGGWFDTGFNSGCTVHRVQSLSLVFLFFGVFSSLLSSHTPPPPPHHPTREVLYEPTADGVPRVTGLVIGAEGRQRVVTADAYVAALDVPGVQLVSVVRL
jgi:hypothetical protein